MDNKYKRKKFYINKNLNFISTEFSSKKIYFSKFNPRIFNISDWRKKFIQYLYVHLATSRFFRAALSHSHINLPENFENFLILGGNHRIRLFSEKLFSSYVLLKNGENANFIKNDIDIRSKYNIPYAPRLYNFGEDWLEEEYFTGKPINRISNNDKKETDVKSDY